MDGNKEEDEEGDSVGIIDDLNNRISVGEFERVSVGRKHVGAGIEVVVGRSVGTFVDEFTKYSVERLPKADADGNSVAGKR